MSRRFLGVGYLLKLSIWFSDGSTPFCPIRNPKICTCFFPTSNFLGLNIIPSVPQNWRYLAHWRKDVLMLSLQISVSSIHLRQLGMLHSESSDLSEKQRNTEFSSFFSSLSSFAMIALYWAT